MDEHDRLAARVSAEQDDVLCTLRLVAGEHPLEDRLFAQLVDLLVEGVFIDLRGRYLEGQLDRAEYADELAELADACRAAGLLPLPSRGV